MITLHKAFSRYHNIVDHNISGIDFIDAFYNYAYDLTYSNDESKISNNEFAKTINKFAFDSIAEEKISIKVRFEQIERAVKQSILLEAIDEEALLEKIFSMLNSEYQYDLAYLPYLIELCRRNDKKSLNVLRSLFVFIMCSYNEIEKYLEQHIREIQRYFYINYFRLVNVEKIILKAYQQTENFEENKDEIPFFNLLVLLFLNVENLDEYFNAFQEQYLVTNEEIQSVISTLKPKNDKNYDIYRYRSKFFYNPIPTLEVVGNKFNLTRERIRQIEKHNISKMQVISTSGKKTQARLLRKIFYSIENGNKYSYLTRDDVMDWLINRGFSDDDAKFVASLLSQHFILCPYYNYDYDIFYDPDIFDYQKTIDDIFARIGPAITEADLFLTCDLLEEKLIRSNYKKNNGFYIPKELTFYKAFEYEAKKLYPNGIKINELKFTDDENKIFKILDSKYGFIEDKTPRGVYNYIARSGRYMTVGDSYFRFIEDCPIISDELFLEMITYIDEKETVAYATLFEKFADDLNAYGIDNQTYFKGMFDYKNNVTDAGYFCSRDAVSCKSNSGTLRDNIVAKILEKNGVFFKKEILDEFPSVKYYVIDFAMATVDGIIHLGCDKYARIDKEYIKARYGEYIKTALNTLLASTTIGNISVNVLFDKMLLEKFEFFEELPFIENSYCLFSLVQSLFPEEFAYRRPIIAVDDDAVGNSYELPFKHAMTLSKFTKQDIDKFTDRIGIRGVGNYQGFINSLSDKFVRVEKNLMIRTDYFNINSKILDKLSDDLSFYINSFGQIETETFKGYNSLPKLYYEWNKYLLVGIIKTYLSRTFSVVETENQYDITDFIIRRIR